MENKHTGIPYEEPAATVLPVLPDKCICTSIFDPNSIDGWNEYDIN